MIVLGEDYEHIQSLGSPACGGIRYENRRLGELYRLILAHGEFEVSEFSLSNHAMFRDRGDQWLTAIPVFPSRAFRQSTIIVPHASPLRTFQQLIGKRVGIVDYSMTAAVWTRGHMIDDYGVHWSELTWVSGLKPRFPTPEGVTLHQTAENLEDLLASGKIDALLAPHPQDWKLPIAERKFRPLLDNITSLEEDYFRRTRIFPIMHTVVIRNEVLKQWPDAPKTLYDLYVQAKQRALKRRLATTFVPWLDRAWDHAMQLFDGDPNPYGLGSDNRKTIETLCSYLLEQKLISRPVEIDELFVPGSNSWPLG